MITDSNEKYKQIQSIEERLKSHGVRYKGISIPQLQAGESVLYKNLENVYSLREYLEINGYRENDIEDIMEFTDDDKAVVITLWLNVVPVMRHRRRFILENIRN